MEAEESISSIHFFPQLLSHPWRGALLDSRSLHRSMIIKYTHEHQVENLYLVIGVIKYVNHRPRDKQKITCETGIRKVLESTMGDEGWLSGWSGSGRVKA